jgi:hypothetical protein
MLCTVFFLQVTSGSGGGVFSGNAASFHSCSFVGNTASTNVSVQLNMSLRFSATLQLTAARNASNCPPCTSLH